MIRDKTGLQACQRFHDTFLHPLRDIFLIQKGKNQLSFCGLSQLKRQRKDAQDHSFEAFQPFRTFAALTLPFHTEKTQLFHQS